MHLHQIRFIAFHELMVKTMSSQIPKPHFKLINMRFSLFFGYCT